MKPPREQIEPGALESNVDRGAIDKHTAWASMAISLKRIADALDPDPAAGPKASLYGLATDLAFHMGQAFENGRRQA